MLVFFFGCFWEVGFRRNLPSSLSFPSFPLSYSFSAAICSAVGRVFATFVSALRSLARSKAEIAATEGGIVGNVY